MALFNIFRRKQSAVNSSNVNKQRVDGNNRSSLYPDDNKSIWTTNRNYSMTSSDRLLDENNAWDRSEMGVKLPDLRLVVFRENEWKDRRLLYDSDVFNFNLQPEKINAQKTNSLPAFSSRDFYTNSPPGCSSSSSNMQKSLPICVVEAEEEASSGNNNFQSDIKLIGETIFGSVSMSYKGDTIKLHQLSNPSRVMLTHVFHLPVKRRKSLQPIIRENFVFETNKAETNSSNNNKSAANTTDLISANTSSSLVNRPTVIHNCNESDSDSQYSTVNSLENFLITAAHHKKSGNIKIPHGSHVTCSTRLNANTATPSPEDVAGSQQSSTGGHGHDFYMSTTPSTPTPITASWKSLQLNNLLSHSFENVVHQRRHSQPIIAENDINANKYFRKRAQIGLAVLFTFNDENNTDPICLRNSRRFRRFLFSHIQLIELELLHLQREISNHCYKKQEFLIAASKAWSQFCLSLRVLFESPRLARPVWLHFTGALNDNDSSICCGCINRKDSGIDTCDYHHQDPNYHSRTVGTLKSMDDNANVVDFETTFINVFDKLIENLDKKETRFFLSTALTAFLSNHSGWVSSVAPPSFWSRDPSCSTGASAAMPADSLSSPRLPKKVNCCDVGCQTVNPFLAQLLDVWSVFNSERHSLRTFFVGRDSNLLLQLVFLFSYFLRCNNLKRLRFDQNYRHYRCSSNDSNQRQPISEKLRLHQPISDRHPSCSYIPSSSFMTIRELMNETVLSDRPGCCCFQTDEDVRDRLFFTNNPSSNVINMDECCPSDNLITVDKNMTTTAGDNENCSKMHVDYDCTNYGLFESQGADFSPSPHHYQTMTSSTALMSRDQCPICEHHCLMGSGFNEMLHDSQHAALFKSAPVINSSSAATTIENNNTISVTDNERSIYQRLFNSTVIETFIDNNIDNVVSNAGVIDNIVSVAGVVDNQNVDSKSTRCRPWTITDKDSSSDIIDQLKSTDIVDSLKSSSASYHNQARCCESTEEDRYENPGLSLQTCLQSDKFVINPNFALSAFVITATNNNSDKSVDKRGYGNNNNTGNQSKRDGSNSNGLIAGGAGAATAGVDRPIREALIKAALSDSSTSCISAVDFLLANTDDWSVKLMTCDSVNISSASDPSNSIGSTAAAAMTSSSIDTANRHVISGQSSSLTNPSAAVPSAAACDNLRISEQTCLPSRAVLDLLENIKALKSIQCEPEFIIMYIEDFLSDVYRKGSALAMLLEESDCTRLDVAQLIGVDQSDAALLLSVCSF